MSLPRIRIELPPASANGVRSIFGTRVTINGIPIPGIRRIQLRQSVEGVPIVTLDVAGEVEVDVEALIELQVAMHRGPST